MTAAIQMVTAMLRPDRLGTVKTALDRKGFTALTVTDVSGRGSQPATTEQWRDEKYVVDLHQKVKLECAVSRGDVREVVETLRNAGETGEKGDGKVFVFDVDEVVQIRTGERGAGVV